jgi:hypothetical protein
MKVHPEISLKTKDGAKKVSGISKKVRGPNGTGRGVLILAPDS